MLKVGVFDSGLGGLTVVKAIMKELKGAEIYYLADSKNAPYGNKSPQEILDYSLKITAYFIKKYQINALVLACNTATAYAIESLRSLYPKLIIIGTEPGIKPAIEQTQTGKVGVLATPATLKGDKYQQLASSLATQKDVTLFEQACPGLVEQIEMGEVKSPETKKMLEKWLAPMRENDVDTIVLGCTHYPLVCDMIEEVMQRRLNLIHTGEAIAYHLLNLAEKVKHKNVGELTINLYYTGKLNKEIVNTLIPNMHTIRHIKIS